MICKATYQRIKYPGFRHHRVHIKPKLLPIVTTLPAEISSSEISFIMYVYTCPGKISNPGSTEGQIIHSYKIGAGLDENSVVLIHQRGDRYEITEYIIDLYMDYLKYYIYY